MNRRFLILIPVVLALIGASPTLAGAEHPRGMSADAETVKRELALAEEARKTAAGAGAEWLQTGTLIDEARKAAENEDWQRALALARQARQQGELALGQAERESSAWRERVVR